MPYESKGLSAAGGRVHAGIRTNLRFWSTLALTGRVRHLLWHDVVQQKLTKDATFTNCGKKKNRGVPAASVYSTTLCDHLISTM